MQLWYFHIFFCVSLVLKSCKGTFHSRISVGVCKTSCAALSQDRFVDSRSNSFCLRCLFVYCGAWSVFGSHSVAHSNIFFRSDIERFGRAKSCPECGSDRDSRKRVGVECCLSHLCILAVSVRFFFFIEFIIIRFNIIFYIIINNFNINIFFFFFFF